MLVKCGPVDQMAENFFLTRLSVSIETSRDSRHNGSRVSQFQIPNWFNKHDYA
jgi:hypothetical protein